MTLLQILYDVWDSRMTPEEALKKIEELLEPNVVILTSDKYERFREIMKL